MPRVEAKSCTVSAPTRCECGDPECPSCGPAQGTRLYTGGHAEECSVCRTPLLTDEEKRGTCSGCATEREERAMMPDTICYLCAGCGAPASASVGAVLDSGTVLLGCPCGGETVVDLDTPEVRTRRYAAAAEILTERDEARTESLAWALRAAALADALRLVLPMAKGSAALADALRLVLPMAKGYAGALVAGSNQRKVAEADAALAPSPSPASRLRAEDGADNDGSSTCPRCRCVTVEPPGAICDHVWGGKVCEATTVATTMEAPDEAQERRET